MSIAKETGDERGIQRKQRSEWTREGVPCTGSMSSSAPSLTLAEVFLPFWVFLLLANKPSITRQMKGSRLGDGNGSWYQPWHLNSYVTTHIIFLGLGFTIHTMQGLDNIILKDPFCYKQQQQKTCSLILWFKEIVNEDNYCTFKYIADIKFALKLLVRNILFKNNTISMIKIYFK